MTKEILITALISVLIFLLGMILFGFLLNSIRNVVCRKFGGLFAILTFPGIMHHELSHALLAFITGAKISSITLFRLKAKNGNLGEVKFVPRGFRVIKAIQVGMTSVAPMLLGTISLFCLITLVNPLLSSWKLALMIYLEFTIFINMSLSKQDIKNICIQSFWLFLILYILFLVFKVDLLTELHNIVDILGSSFSNK